MIEGVRMSVNTCVCCGNIVPEEDRMVCKRCEQKEIKLGKILQTMNSALSKKEFPILKQTTSLKSPLPTLPKCVW